MRSVESRKGAWPGPTGSRRFTQVDLQREFHLARQNASQAYRIPSLSLPPDNSLDTADPSGIGRALATTRHLLEMFRRQLTDVKLFKARPERGG